MRPLIFGEVLYDRFPDGAVVLGGAPFNVAWHMQAFGLEPLIVTRVGDDDLGEAVLAAMADWGLDRGGVQVDDVHPTGTVEVTFRDGEPSYAITDGVAYDFIAPQSLPGLPGEWLLYHGTLAVRNQESARALDALCARAGGERFVDVNLRAPWWDRDRVLASLPGATWVKLNEEELAALIHAGDEATRRADLLALVGGHVVLTAGDRGATVLNADGAPPLAIRPSRATTVVDTVGAGDAFSSVFLAGRLLAWPPDVTIRRAQDFASAVVGIRGATPADMGFYRRFREVWQLN